jgi:glycosyltransferase involved in cell wall biosynthesis
MPNVSGVLVTYNEEKVVRKALESLSRFTDEIILFDSFSTDNTIDIAKEFNCQIYQHEFDNHRNQKNRAIEKCTKDWVFLIDADEYLEEKLISSIELLINNKDMVDTFYFPRKNYVDGDGPMGFPDTQARLFRNYVRHWGHPFHHRADGGSKKSTAVMEFGSIVHDKTLARQEKQNKLYYSMRPQDYKEVPNGAENVKINKDIIQDQENVNVYRDYILKQQEK